MSVNENPTVALATLAQSTGILMNSPTMLRGGSILSIRGAIAIASLTAGDGPFLFGVMGGDLTLAELEAYLELGGPVRPDDLTVVEIQTRGRHIRQLGVIRPSGDGTQAILELTNVRTSALRFSESGEGSGWKWWIYNMGVTMTTGATARLIAQSFIRFNPSG